MSNRKGNKINLFKLCLLTISIIYLWSILLTNGFKPINKKNIFIEGTISLNKDLIIETLDSNNSIYILRTNPKKLEKKLKNELPIEDAIVTRRILDPSINIKILERKPVSFGKKYLNGTYENGLIDKYGAWISSKYSFTLSNSTDVIFVDGWTPYHQKLISLIINNAKEFNIPIKKIIIREDKTTTLENIDGQIIKLGDNQNIASYQIQLLNHLYENLPEKFLENPNLIIDLENPNRPKLIAK